MERVALRGGDCVNNVTLTNEEAHKAFDEAMAQERAWAGQEYQTHDYAEKARAHHWRWHWLDVALRAAQIHNSRECSLCQRRLVEPCLQ